MRGSTDLTFRSPVILRHDAFGEIRMRFDGFDRIARRVRHGLSNGFREGLPVVRCAVRDMRRAVFDARTRIPPEEGGLRRALAPLGEYDYSPIEIDYPELRARGARGRTHCRDPVLQAACRRHRVSIPSPPMGVEAVSGDAPHLSGERPHTALTGLPAEFPDVRLRSRRRTGEETDVSMRWREGVTYVTAASFATIVIPARIPEAMLSRLAGRTADTVAEVPGFERVTILRSIGDPRLERTIIQGRRVAG